MGFKFLTHELVNPFHIPDRTFLLQFPKTAHGADITPCNGNWKWFGEAAPVTVVNEDDIKVNGGLDGEDAPTGVGSPSPISRQLPDKAARMKMRDLDARLYNEKFAKQDWCDINLEDLRENATFVKICDQLRVHVTACKKAGCDLRRWESIGIVTTACGSARYPLDNEERHAVCEVAEIIATWFNAAVVYLPGTHS